MRPPCPEAIYGEHSDPNTSGNCVYCGFHLGRPDLRPRPWTLPDYWDRIERDRHGSDPIYDDDPDDLTYGE